MGFKPFQYSSSLALHYWVYSAAPRKSKYWNNLEKLFKRGWYWNVVGTPGLPILPFTQSPWWSLNNPHYSGPWFHIMPTTLPGNPAHSHHTGYWPNGHSRTEGTTYNVATTTSSSSLGGFLRDPDLRHWPNQLSLASLLRWAHSPGWYGTRPSFPLACNFLSP